MKYKTIKVFDWQDIEKELCSELGISESKFHKYWSDGWVEYFDPMLHNDTISFCDCDEDIKSKIEQVTEDGQDWLIPFVRAVYKVWDKYKIEYVEYCW